MLCMHGSIYDLLELMQQQSWVPLQVDYEAICAALQRTAIQVTKSSQLFTLTNHMTYHPWGTVAWAESMTKIEDKVTKAIKAALASEKYDRPVLDAFNAVFEQSTLTPLKLKRFGSLKALLLSEILPARMAEAKKAAALVIHDMRQKALMQLNYDTGLDDTFQKLDSGIRGCIIKHVINNIKNHPLNLPESFQLAEDDKVKKKRTRLNDKLTQIVTATDKISRIEEAISVGTDTDFSPRLAADQEVPDVADQAYPEAAESSTAATAAAAAAPMTDELQMQAVPQQSVQSSHHSSGGATTTASSHATPVPVSVAAQVSDTAEHPLASGSIGSETGAGPSSLPDGPMPEGEAPTTNRNLACSMAQLGTMQLDSPRSAANIEAETETVPLSPTASVAASVAESFVHIM